MSNTPGFFVQPNPIFENEPPEGGPVFTYSIGGLSEIPEALLPCQSKTGYYKSQIGFDLVRHSGTASAYFTVDIAIYGDVNPGYSAALCSLFGDEIGQILTQSSEVYRRAMRAHLEEVQNEEGLNDEDVRYAGGVSVARRLLNERQAPELAEQVLHRLMTDSVFP
jgi:hypothetical protein